MSEAFFDSSTFYTWPEPTERLIEDAQARLGRSLPEAYLKLLRVKNGGRPVRRCLLTGFATSWAPDHFEIEALRGLGGKWGIDTDGPFSSASMIREWGYPDLGIVICDMPSGGHDAVMLDYSEPGEHTSMRTALHAGSQVRSKRSSSR